MTRRISNHDKAPEAAKFVKEMRRVFGEDVKVLYVKEGEFEIGEPSFVHGPSKELQKATEEIESP